MFEKEEVYVEGITQRASALLRSQILPFRDSRQVYDYRVNSDKEDLSLCANIP